MFAKARSRVAWELGKGKLSMWLYHVNRRGDKLEFKSKGLSWITIPINI